MRTQNTTSETQGATADSVTGEVLDKERLAPRLHISKRSVDNWMRRGWLPYIRIGKTIRFYWPDVLAKINERRVN